MGGSPDASTVRRWPSIVAIGPYVLLVGLAAVTAGLKHGPGLLVDLGLCGLAAVWILWMYTVHPAWRERPRMMGIFLAGLIVITMVLVIRDPWFGLFCPAGYIYAFGLLPWPAEPAAVAGVAVAAATAQASTVPKHTLWGVAAYAAVIAANVLPMCALAWIWRRAEQQTAEREQAFREVSEAKRRLEESIAENTSLHERLMAQAREAGVADERRRMAREIHDTLAQGLIGIVTQLQAAEQAADERPRWHRHVRAATDLARESLAEARRSVHALRPGPLETARLSEALTGVAEGWAARHDIAVQVTTTGTAHPMSQEAEFTLLRTAQEALTNVARHARASRVGLTLSYLDGEVALDVRDDGQGFEPNGASSGFGLEAMRQRVESLSGMLQIESEPGVGTAVSARVPTVPAEVDA